MKYKKELLWTVLPCLIGLGGIYLIPAPYLSLIIIVPFWFWVGTRFSRLNVSKLRSFVLGNAAWGICLVMFIWQFLLESELHRNTALAAVSLTYISPFYVVTHALPPIGYRFYINTAIVILTLAAYFTMFVIFSLGFVWGRFRSQPASSTKVGEY